MSHTFKVKNRLIRGVRMEILRLDTIGVPGSVASGR